MRTLWLNAFAVTAVVIAVTLVVVKNIEGDTSSELLNVSYDPTRELFQDLNRQFIAQFARQTGKKLKIQQSHGGSSRQAQAVMDGLPADVVRSEEHTSELQSLRHLVCRLLLEK